MRGLLMKCGFMLIAVAAVLVGPPSPAQSQEPTAYPARPIRIIVPTVPGAPPDVVARLVSERLAPALGQPVIVENRPGAIGTIGLHAVAKAVPDGYTLGLIASPFVAAPGLLAKVPYDTERDLAPVILIDRHYSILVVAAGTGVNTVADLVARAKAAPGTLKFSSAGNGTPPHLAGELFKREAGVDIIHVPYKGALANVVAVLSGEVDMTFAATGAGASHIRSGKLRGLATIAPAPTRIGAFPELPTLAELGYAGVQVTAWEGIVAPRGTPPVVVERLRSAVATIVAEPEVRQRFAAIGMEAAGDGPEVLATQIHSGLRMWSRLVRETGIQAD
jgi:tripartite-type tricarboxylate transporter receptor subunit TctC